MTIRAQGMTKAKGPGWTGQARIGRCTRGAAVVEYALAAALVATAAASVQSPRLHPVKDETCNAKFAGCPKFQARNIAPRPRALLIREKHGDLPYREPDETV